MKRYRSYSDSGIEWVGDVPDHWAVGPVRRWFEIVNGGTPASGNEAFWDGDIVWLTPDDLGRSISHRIEQGRRTITQEGLRNSSARVTPAGSIVVSTRAPIGHVNIATVETATNQGCRTLIPGQRIHGTFAYYAFVVSRPILESLGQGSTFMELTPVKLGSLCLPVPPLDEQRDIAAFLDRETERIDSLIAKKRLLIERLQEYRTALITRTVTRGLPAEAARAAGLDPSPRLKHSAVEWLGDVPEHWSTPKLGARYEIVLGKMLDESRITGEHLLPYLRNIDVQWDSVNLRELAEMDIRPREAERYTVRGGDVLVCEGGEPGRAAIVPEVATSTGFQKALHRLRPLSDDENPRFLFYTLAFAADYGVFEARGNPNTILHLTGEMLREYRFPQPPTEEQQFIVDYLDKEVGRLRSLTERVEAAIARLSEYRTALITAAVTGKIDVRGAASSDRSSAESPT